MIEKFLRNENEYGTAVSCLRRTSISKCIGSIGIGMFSEYMALQNS